MIIPSRVPGFDAFIYSMCIFRFGAIFYRCDWHWLICHGWADPPRPHPPPLPLPSWPTSDERRDQHKHQRLGQQTSKSDQCQIAPAASPELGFPSYSDERWLYFKFPLPHLCTTLKLRLCWENYVPELGSEGLIIRDSKHLFFLQFLQHILQLFRTSSQFFLCPHQFILLNLIEG